MPLTFTQREHYKNIKDTDIRNYKKYFKSWKLTTKPCRQGLNFLLSNHSMSNTKFSVMPKTVPKYFIIQFKGGNCIIKSDKKQTNIFFILILSLNNISDGKLIWKVNVLQHCTIFVLWLYFAFYFDKIFKSNFTIHLDYNLEGNVILTATCVSGSLLVVCSLWFQTITNADPINYDK